MNNMIDIALRQQVYLEAVKNNETEAIDPVLEQLIAALVGMFAKTGVAKLSDLSRSRYTSLLRKLIKKLNALIKSARTMTLKRLYYFMQAEVKLNTGILTAYTGKKARAPYLGNDSVKLWKEYGAVILAASGETLVDTVKSYYDNTRNTLVRETNKAYADGMEMTALVTALVGTRANALRDGISAKLARQYGTTIRTAMQSIVNNVKHGVYGLFYAEYQWISVIDDVTTPVCRERDGKVYAYGKGNPIPPAHYNCRSVTVPVTGEKSNGVPTNFADWVQTQDTAFQNYTYGAKEAARIRKTGLTQGANSRFITKRKSSVNDYANAKHKIIGE